MGESLPRQLCDLGAAQRWQVNVQCEANNQGSKTIEPRDLPPHAQEQSAQKHFIE